MAKNNLGQSLIEFALTIPILLFFIFGLIDVGLAINKQFLLNNLTKELSRAASIGKEIDELNNISLELSKTIINVQSISISEEILGDGTRVTKFTIFSIDSKQINIYFFPSIQSRIKGNFLIVEANFIYVPITPLIDTFVSLPLKSKTSTLVEISK